jgi:hypothetical protein
MTNEMTNINSDDRYRYVLAGAVTGRTVVVGGAVSKYARTSEVYELRDVATNTIVTFFQLEIPHLFLLLLHI